ncbi:KTSC domain containing protein [uncultured Caudovirales phage]|uniref:KTSC domain containing protein n=1 Tax=uncultured Caudovirales phage TaxID=2100421 RepID=A0A6J5LKB3_9CAUD|nr:KTSC domain containing protein [uncultured Caudovirales phage]
MELQELEELLRELLQTIQLMVESGEEMSDELQGQIAQTLELLFNRIEEQKGSAPTQTQIPEVPTGEFPSSNVNGFKYDPKNQEMLVQFHGPYPQTLGPIYKYSGVPQFIFDIISRGAVGPKTSGQNRYHRWLRGVTPSLGASVNSLLKAGGFSYQKVH